jgi:predicted TIM-barrel fold metal-dependent hydrolase
MGTVIDPSRGDALVRARATAFREPPPRAVDGPIIDAHTHVARAHVEELLAAADLYGVRRLIGICELDRGLALRDRYGDRLIIATTLAWEHRGDPARFAAENRVLLARAAAEGVRIVKLWFAPRIYDRFDGMHLDAPLLDSVFDGIAEHRLNVLVHISDPDRWFATKYTDTAKYGTKPEQYPQLERRLAQYPSVHVLAAHMGGDPEHLGHLGGLLDRYPNLSLDTSATRWVVRELGRRREAARAFFAHYADRLLFGTDQLVLDEQDPERYRVRYWIHQMFWETDLECPLPLDDPDADGEPVLRGLALPPEVLRRIYWENAVRWLETPALPEPIGA